ncbi:hypothetical protein PO883_18595 [Massilia sp. DJPM01]|nr:MULTISPECIES: hypothetical protein [Massilia]MDM5179209.1 hypothetical protein [Massilia sp. DJPM01]
MKLQLVNYTCGACQHQFDAPEIPGSDYGTFLLRTEANDELRYVDGIADPTFDEVDHLLQEEPAVAALPARKRTALLWAVYGPLACDPDSQGQAFHIGLKPRCPSCRTGTVTYWEFTEPARFIDIDVRPVSHAAWNGLTADEKQQRVAHAAGIQPGA